MVCELANVTWLNSEILEGLRLLVDYLVNVLHLDLFSGHPRPPKHLIEELCSGLEELPGHVDVSSLREDFLVDKFRNLRRGVLLGSVELKGLCRGVVVVKHQLEGMADVNGLGHGQFYTLLRRDTIKTDVNRPVFLPHVI